MNAPTWSPAQQDVAAVACELPAAVLEGAGLIPERVLGAVLVDVFQDPEGRYSAAEVEGWIHEWAATWRQPAAVRRLGFGAATPASLIQRYIQGTPASVPPFSWDALREFFRWSDADLPGILADTQTPICATNSDRLPTNVGIDRDALERDRQVGRQRRDWLTRERLEAEP